MLASFSLSHKLPGICRVLQWSSFESMSWERLTRQNFKFSEPEHNDPFKTVLGMDSRKAFVSLARERQDSLALALLAQDIDSDKAPRLPNDGTMHDADRIIEIAGLEFVTRLAVVGLIYCDRRGRSSLDHPNDKICADPKLWAQVKWESQSITGFG